MSRIQSAVVGRTAATNREAAKQLRATIKDEKAKAAEHRKAVTAARATLRSAEREFNRAEKLLTKQQGVIAKLEAKRPAKPVAAAA